jgi:hypothetical protein
MTRRELTISLAASAGAALIAESAGGQEQKGAVTASGEDIRVSLIERSRGKDFTPEQRKAVLENIRNNDKQWAEGRAKFSVPDNAEPAFVFTPIAPREGRKAR